QLVHISYHSIPTHLRPPYLSPLFPYTTLFRSGVTTVGSCGGHEIITNPSQWQAGTWYVKFNLPSGRFGWYLLEHLAWVINEDYRDRKSTRLNSSHVKISYAVFCLKKKIL